MSIDAHLAGPSVDPRHPEPPTRSDGIHAPPRTRRIDDDVVTLLTSSPDGRVSWELPFAGTHAQRLSNPALVLDLTPGEVLLVSAADAHIMPRGAGGAELQARAAAAARALQRERERIARRLRMPDLLLAYADALLGARTDTDVYTALRYAAGTLVSSWTAILFVAGGAAHDAAFHALADPVLTLSVAPLPARTATWFARPLVITRAEIDADARRALAPLAGIMDDTAAAQLLCAPVAGDALLVLIERRRDRVVTAEERDLVNALVSQAEGALRRLGVERQVAAWALQDQPGPLEGPVI